MRVLNDMEALTCRTREARRGGNPEKRQWQP